MTRRALTLVAGAVLVSVAAAGVAALVAAGVVLGRVQRVRGRLRSRIIESDT